MKETGLKNNNPKHELTEEDARKGGIKSGEVRRARKTFKEVLLTLLEMDDNNNKVSIAVLQKALNGDLEAFKTIRDTIGEKPIDRMEQEVVNKIRVNITDD